MLSNNAALNKTPQDFDTARYNMIESQLRPNMVRDERILEAMGTLPRELFVASDKAGIAYIDEDLCVAKGRYLLEPMVLARMLESAAIQASEKVLDIAPATGYSTAVLAKMVKNVVALECDAALQMQARTNLNSLQIDVDIQTGPLPKGLSAKGPYDVIMVNGCIEVLPEALFEQLSEGGRLIAVVRHFGPAHASHNGEARIYQKLHGQISARALFDANVGLLPGFEAPQKFVF